MMKYFLYFIFIIFFMTPWVGYAYEVECSDFGCGTAFPECDCMTFDVNYNGGDGLGSAPTVPTSCTYGTTCLAPENTFYRADYQFSHWACKLPNGSECSKAIYYVGEDISQAIVSTEESITLTAAWVPANAFTIQYNTFGGVLSTEAVNKKTSCTETSETLVLPTATEITRANSTFKGWKNAKTNQMVTEIPAGTCNSEFVLEAQWSCNTGFASNADATACDAIVYNITYNLNGGTNNSSNPLTYKITDDDIVFVAPTRANSKFEGWFSDSMFTTAKTQITKGSTGDQAVYAKWSCNDGYTSNADNTACLANTITIAYDESKGAEISNGTCTYGETFTIADATSRTGYTFARWKLANGTLVDGGTQIVCNNTTLGVVNGTTNAVVAQWTANQYVVSYECDSSDPESLSPAPENISYDSEYTVLASYCAKKGYTFTGWTVSDTDTVVNPGDKFVWNYTSNKTLTARWSINSYKCESGEYLAAGATSCSECEAGSYCVGGTYDYSAVQTQGKSTCGTNSYSDAGAGSCTDCATDYTNSDDHAGIASCKITCPAGTYVAEAGKGCVSVELGINMLLKLLQDATKILAPAGYDIEIVEKHHNQKVDAPSGTALALADSINEVLDNEYNYKYDRSQERKKRDKKEIGISAVRGGTIVGEHEVIYAGEDEVIEFKHTAYSKAVFAKGAVEAGKFLKGKGPGMYGMQDVIVF